MRTKLLKLNIVQGFQNHKTLITSIRRDRVRTPAERRFNREFKRIRVWIEHTFGLLKKMFPVLLIELRKYKQIYSQATIFACTILYNISRDLNESDPPLPRSMSQRRFDRLMQNTFNNSPDVVRNRQNYIRDQLIQQYFAQPT